MDVFQGLRKQDLPRVLAESHKFGGLERAGLIAYWRSFEGNTFDSLCLIGASFSGFSS